MQQAAEPAGGSRLEIKSGVRFQLLEAIAHKMNLLTMGQELSYVEMVGGMEEDLKHVCQLAWKLPGIQWKQFRMKLTATPIC